MKIAKATPQDLESGLMLLGLLDTLSSGYYPSDSDDTEDDPLYFDEEDPKHLAQLWRRLKACLDAAPGFQGRVIGGAHTLMHPANAVIDPDDDVLGLHPRIVAALSDAERFRGLLLWLLYHHQGSSSEIGQPIRQALGIGQFDDLSLEQIQEGTAAARNWAKQAVTEEKGGVK